ncbi:MAG: hypothetical protein RIR96_1268 [Bacteroidota bacterium]|jgi:hypothetical protein
MTFKKITISAILFICIATFSGCQSDESQLDQKNPMETGRRFVENLLKGDFASVKPILSSNETNNSSLNSFTLFYASVSPELKSENAIRSWEMEKWEEKDENNITMIVNHEMLSQPLELSLKKTDGIWFINFTHFP